MAAAWRDVPETAERSRRLQELLSSLRPFAFRRYVTLGSSCFPSPSKKTNLHVTVDTSVCILHDVKVCHLANTFK